MSILRTLLLRLAMVASIAAAMTTVSSAHSDSADILTATENYYAYLFKEESFSNVGIVEDGPDAIITFSENSYVTLDAFLREDTHGNWSVAITGKGPFTAALLEASGVPASRASFLTDFGDCTDRGRYPGVRVAAPARYFTSIDKHTHEKRIVHIRRADGYRCEK